MKIFWLNTWKKSRPLYFVYYDTIKFILFYINKWKTKLLKSGLFYAVGNARDKLRFYHTLLGYLARNFFFGLNLIVLPEI